MNKYKKTLCEQTGHDWQNTTASNYHVCLRSGCKAAQRFNGQTWIDATRRTTTPPQAPAYIQLTIGEEPPCKTHPCF
jgi:hypothetical protein